MNRRWSRAAAAAAAVVLAGAGVAGAEVKVQEKTHFKFEGVLGGVVNLFGGKTAREGVTSTVAVKGDRRSRISDLGGEIVDLAEEKVYTLDVKNRTYTVQTFAELRRKMQEQEEKAAKQAPREERGGKPAPAQKPEKEYTVDFNVKNTGEKKVLNGFDTHQVLMTVALHEKGKTLDQSGGLLLTSDMWITPSVKGTKELATFEQRYFEKLHGPAAAAEAQASMAMLLGTYPQLREGMARMSSETAKMEGTPVSTATTISAVKSPEQMQQPAGSREGEEEQPKGLGGLLGRKLGKKLGGKDEEKAGAPTPKNQSVLMTTTNEILSVSPEVTAADVAVPAGYRQK